MALIDLLGDSTLTDANVFEALSSASRELDGVKGCRTSYGDDLRRVYEAGIVWPEGFNEWSNLAKNRYRQWFTANREQIASHLKTQ